MLAFWSGLFSGLSLIMAIGAQNAYVLRQALTRQHVFMTATFCFVSDVILIVAGTAGLGALIHAAPFAMEIIRWFGVAYLLWFAFNSVRSAFKGEVMDTSGGKVVTTKAVLITLFGFTYLNPHVYLDTVIFLGALANQFADYKWTFALGVSIGSAIWFYSLAYGARGLSRFMTKKVFWKILDLSIAAIMVAIAIMLAFFRF